MYKLVYYYKKTSSPKDIMKDFTHMDEGQKFRLRKDALHWLWEVVQNLYRTAGYSTEKRAGMLYCYKSEKAEDGSTRIIEMRIEVEKE